MEGQNEARLQAYAQQQAARQAVPLQASQPRNAYGWLAQRIGNVFSPAAYAAPIPQRPAPPSLPSKADLNERMRLIEDVLGRRMFDKHDYAYPYEQDSTGKKLVIDSKISYATQMIRAGIFKEYSNEATKYNFSPQEKERLRQKLKDGFTPEEKTLLNLAGDLNEIILQYGKNDDAMATALGIEAVAKHSTHSATKTLDVEKFTFLLQTTFIDQPYDIPTGAIAKHYEVGQSPLAYALFGGPRIQSQGYDEKYQDKHGGVEANQAHHLAMFIILGIRESQLRANTEGVLLDVLGGNVEDINLAFKGVMIGNKIKNRYLINAKEIYNEIKE